jgi:hypothetical protein
MFSPDVLKFSLSYHRVATKVAERTDFPTVVYQH